MCANTVYTLSHHRYKAGGTLLTADLDPRHKPAKYYYLGERSSELCCCTVLDFGAFDGANAENL